MESCLKHRGFQQSTRDTASISRAGLCPGITPQSGKKLFHRKNQYAVVGQTSRWFTADQQSGAPVAFDGNIAQAFKVSLLDFSGRLHFNRQFIADNEVNFAVIIGSPIA